MVRNSPFGAAFHAAPIVRGATSSNQKNILGRCNGRWSPPPMRGCVWRIFRCDTHYL